MTGRTLDGVSPSDTKLLMDFLNRLGSFENANRSQAKNLSRSAHHTHSEGVETVRE